MRLFTAILLSDEARAHLDLMGDRLAQFIHAEMGYRSADQMKWVAVENLHLTLKFLGEVEDDRVPELVDRLKSEPPGVPANYLLRANRLELLPPRRGPVRVIAVGVGDHLEPLHNMYDGIKRIAETFGVPLERRPSTPHVTLARCRVPIPAAIRGELVRWSGFTAGPFFDASRFALVQSTLKPSGPEYRTIAMFPAT